MAKTLSRGTKLQATTININTIASSEILHHIETTVLLDMHEKKSIAGFLTNAESWNLSNKEEKELEKLEIQAVKFLFDLPVHMPTVAILYSFGLLYTTQRIDQTQLIYLHRLLQRDNNDTTKNSLLTLRNKEAGWFERISTTLKKSLWILRTVRTIFGLL